MNHKHRTPKQNFYIAFLIVGIGSALEVIGANMSPEQELNFLLVAGAMIAVSGIVWGFLTIRCPRCGRFLMGRPFPKTCPRCHEKLE